MNTLDKITAAEMELLRLANERLSTFERIRREAEAAEDMARVAFVGKAIAYGGKAYRISRINAGWDGTFKAHGRRVLASGKMGSQDWDIGTIYPSQFEVPR